MMKKGFVLLASVLFLIAGAALIFIAPSFSTPRFVVSNDTADKVLVIARWRQQEKDLGVLLAGGQTEFTVKDEAAMEVIARFPDGHSVSNDPVYCTAGMVYKFEITASKIEATFE